MEHDAILRILPVFISYLKHSGLAEGHRFRMLIWRFQLHVGI